MEFGTARRPGEGAPLHGDSQRLLWKLDEFEADPHLSLVAMQQELAVDLGLRLGFEPGLASSQPDAIMDKRLSVDQYEAVKSFEELTKIFCNHSLRTPREFGDWLSEPRRNFRYKTPIDVLFENFTESGFNKRTLLSVLREGDAMFGLQSYDDAYLESLL